MFGIRRTQGIVNLFPQSAKVNDHRIVRHFSNEKRLNNHSQQGLISVIQRLIRSSTRVDFRAVPQLLQKTASMQGHLKLAHLVGARFFSTGNNAYSKKPEQISVLTPEERHKILFEWNQTQQLNYPSHLCNYQIFEEIVETQPQAPAIMVKGQTVLTYKQLNEKANQLARYLIDLGVGKEVLVGICLGRSPKLMAAILAVFKAGGAYVPLDPTLPQDRLEYMLSDSGASILITEGHHLEKFRYYEKPTICLDPESEAFRVVGSQNKDNLGKVAELNNLAYIIYTSGTTGRPKGVQIEHHNISNMASAQSNTFGVSKNDRILQFSPICFDASVWEFHGAFLNGASLCLAMKNDLLPGEPFLKTLAENKVTIMTVPPSILRATPYKELPHLRVVVTAGEACSKDLIETWGKGKTYINAYGPTETTCISSTPRQARPTEIISSNSIRNPRILT